MHGRKNIKLSTRVKRNLPASKKKYFGPWQFHYRFSLYKDALRIYMQSYLLRHQI